MQNWSKVKPPSMVLSSGSCADLYSVTTVSCLAYGSFVYTKKNYREESKRGLHAEMLKSRVTTGLYTKVLMSVSVEVSRV